MANWNQLIARSQATPTSDDTLTKLNFINLILMHYESANIPEKPDPEFDTLYISKLRAMDQVRLPESFTENKELIYSVDDDGNPTVKIKVDKVTPKRESNVKQHSSKKALLVQALPVQREATNDFVTKVTIGQPEMPNVKISFHTDDANNDRDYQTSKLTKAAGLHFIKVNQTFLKAQRLGTW